MIVWEVPRGLISGFYPNFIQGLPLENVRMAHPILTFWGGRTFPKRTDLFESLRQMGVVVPGDHLPVGAGAVDAIVVAVQYRDAGIARKGRIAKTLQLALGHPIAKKHERDEHANEIAVRDEEYRLVVVSIEKVEDLLGAGTHLGKLSSSEYFQSGSSMFSR